MKPRAGVPRNGGVAAVIVDARTKHRNTAVPAVAWADRITAALATGAIAGLLPAVRAAASAPPASAPPKPYGPVTV